MPDTPSSRPNRESEATIKAIDTVSNLLVAACATIITMLILAALVLPTFWTIRDAQLDAHHSTAVLNAAAPWIIAGVVLVSLSAGLIVWCIGRRQDRASATLRSQSATVAAPRSQR
jgi:hypothetical protein